MPIYDNDPARISYEKERLEQVKSTSIPIENVKDVKNALLIQLNWNPDPEEHKFEGDHFYPISGYQYEVLEKLTDGVLIVNSSKDMKVLVACEESQEVCKAFRNKGHEAYSLDVLETSGGYPKYHIKEDVVNHLSQLPDRYYDIIIIHIPCTKVAVSGNRWYGVGMPRHNERLEYIDWAKSVWELVNKKSKRCALENPVSVIFQYIKYDKLFYIQPWMFGHGETKKTGIAVVGLPKLIPTNIVEGREQRIWKMPPSPDRAKLRSKTFSGIAEAIAEQWG